MAMTAALLMMPADVPSEDAVRSLYAQARGALPKGVDPAIVGVLHAAAAHVVASRLERA